MTVEAPAASTLRFALLIATVVAAGTAMLISIQEHLPGQAEALNDRLTHCGGRAVGRPDLCLGAGHPRRQ
jgi:hypothetical protein